MDDDASENSKEDDDGDNGSGDESASADGEDLDHDELILGNTIEFIVDLSKCL